ncbi:MAG: hypothetical protein HY940_04000 [Gammaproteobacteria bacterium]|nr:hypothetical protein [Gammaproteobacteria bacterium]
MVWLLILFVIQVAVLLAKVVWLPPQIWDEWVYHLPPAVEWYQRQFIPSTIETSVSVINGAPLGMTVLAWWFFAFFRDDMLVELPMLLWALLLVPVSYAVMRQSGVDRPWAVKFAIVIFFIPAVLLQATTVKDHLGLNISFITGLLLLALFLRSHASRHLLAAAFAFGLMLGYKITAPLLVLVALLVFSCWIVLQQRSLFRESASRLMLLRSCLLSLVVLVLIGGYWYLRNVLVFGRLHGAYETTQGEGGALVEQSSGALQSLAGRFSHFDFLTMNLQELLPRLFDYQFIYGADLVNVSGFGPQFVVFGLLACVIAVAALFSARLRAQPVALLTTTALLLFIAYLFVDYNPNSYRKLSFMPMVMISAAAVWLHHYGFLQSPGQKRVVNGLLLVCVIWSGINMLPPQYTNPRTLKDFITADAQYRTTANYTKWFVVERPQFYRQLQNFSVHEPIVYLGSDRSNFPGESAPGTWAYLYYDRQWQRRAIYANQQQMLECQGAVCVVRAGFKEMLQRQHAYLVSSCKLNRCLEIRDPELFAVLPGLYYYLGKEPRP